MLSSIHKISGKNLGFINSDYYDFHDFRYVNIFKKKKVNKMNDDLYNIEEKKRVSSWTAFHKSGRAETLGWGLIFIWGALVLLLEVADVVSGVSWWDGWAVFFIGFGVIALSGGIIYAYIKDYSKAGWNLFFGFGAIGFGLSAIIQSDIIWVLVLFAIGAILLIGAFVWKNGSDTKDLC
jgi:Flp pilus assembly protein TadB